MHKKAENRPNWESLPPPTCRHRAASVSHVLLGRRNKREDLLGVKKQL